MENLKDQELRDADYYSLLNLSTFATTAEIRSSYRSHARKLVHLPTSHPQYVKVKEAYDILTNDATRRKYDDSIRPDPYKILAVGKDSGLREIIVSYRKLARTHHPDKGGDLRAFDQITEAYRILSDPQKRSDYDRNGFSSEELELPNVIVKNDETKGRTVVANRDIGMGEVVLYRERPFAAVLSNENGAYKSYCHNCFVSLRDRKTKETCKFCGAQYCTKIGCGLHCERHKRECCFNKEWKESDLCRFNVYERPPDKMLFLVHAVYSGGLVYQESSRPIVPIKATPLQINLHELSVNVDEVDSHIAEQNYDYAVFVADFMCKHGGMMKNRYEKGVKELVTLLRSYDTNSIQIFDNVISRPIARGLFLSTSLFNHSCSPNCFVSFEGDCATIRTLRHIKCGEELCVSYINIAMRCSVRQAQLKKQWHFDCDCDRCLSTINNENESIVHGTFCPIEDCRGQLLVAEPTTPSADKEPTLGATSCGPNPLTVNSVPILDQSFLPSGAGYVGEKLGYEYREGRHGLGYYQHEDKYGYPIQMRGDSLGGLHQCSGCARKGVDIYLQQAFIITAERHKYFHTHKQALYDQRLAAHEAVEQLQQVLNLELSCLHPFNPSVIETIRSLNTMYGVVEKHSQCIKLLRILVIHDQLVYGVVSPQTAHTSGMLARSYLESSMSLTSKTSETLLLALTHAEEAVKYAEKAQITLSVIFGRTHQVSTTAYVTLELAHSRVEYLEFEAKSIVTTENKNNDDAKEDNHKPEKHLLCPTCGTVSNLSVGSRILSCQNCSTFCTEANLYVKKTTKVHEPLVNQLFDEILEMIALIEDNLHQPGDMLPCTFLLKSPIQKLPKRRSTSFPLKFYDNNMKQAILAIESSHLNEWCPCETCSAPRSTKRCSGCKTTRYCSLGCATRDFARHKLVCPHFLRKSAKS